MQRVDGETSYVEEVYESVREALPLGTIAFGRR